VGEAPRDRIPAHGSADVDIRILVNNAIQLLRTSMVAKVQMQATLNKPRGRPKKDVGITAAIDADRFAMASLEEVAKSSALNINCIMRAQQANLVWHLYISLVYLVTPPPMMAPPQQQSSFNMVTCGGQNPTPIQAAIAAAQAHHQQGAQGPPVPHQFLLRDQQQMHPPISPSPGPGPAPAEHVKMYTPGFLPRSGQSMRFSFPPPTKAHPNASEGRGGASDGQGSTHPGTMKPQHGMPASPGEQHMLADQHMQFTPQVALSGYPHPGAVVEDR